MMPMEKMQQIAEDNYKKNINYEGYETVKVMSIPLTEKIYDQACLVVYEMCHHFKKQYDKSKLQIAQLKKDIGNGDIFPPIVVIDFKRYLCIADGNHRIIALYESGKDTVDAMFIRR